MISPSSPTLIWYQPQQPVFSAELQAREAQLKAAGFEIQVHSQARDFHLAAAQAMADMARVTPLLFMISGVNNESLAAISRLRMQSVYLPIMVTFPSFIEERILQALYSGADDYCVLDNSAALWVAKIECLLRRSRHPGLPASRPTWAETTSKPESIESSWALRDDGWVLQSPEGAHIALTTTERQFLLILCSQQDRRASHHQLLKAISEPGNEADVGTGHNRLGVVISRLKRKAALEGAVIPIRSIYKWGYMFSAPVELV